MPNENEAMTFRKWVAVIATIMGAFMAVLDIQITSSSLRDIAGGIAATPDEGSWISTAYLVGEIVTIGLTAWLADVAGPVSNRGGWYYIRSCHDGERHLEVRVGNAETPGGGRQLFGAVATSLAHAGLARGARIVRRKPRRAVARSLRRRR